MIPTRELHILLVEDNPADVCLVKEAFKECPLRNKLSVVEDGEQAIDFLRRKGKFQAVSLPDVVLLDLNLPRKDGREVLNEIKNDSMLSEIPIIVLTTSDAEADVHHAYKLHANCYLTKPIDIGQFLRKVRAFEEFWMTFARLPKRSDQLLSV
ncbi:MAG TPA: response regulator [Bryobacteraceae bacterium]|nr:response regulator [Bryobacteraceae bacterium]